MAHLGNGVEYGLHCLLWLARPQAGFASSRDLADLQGVSPSFLAKIFPKLEKAGVVTASDGVHGGYRLARPAAEISVLDVVDAIEGPKPLFDCQEVRGKCAVFGSAKPDWSTHGVCAVHSVMIRAEQAMRAELAKTSLAKLAETVAGKAPAGFAEQISTWLADRLESRAKTRSRANRTDSGRHTDAS